jgi:hypothetical protein
LIELPDDKVVSFAVGGLKSRAVVAAAGIYICTRSEKFFGDVETI